MPTHTNRNQTFPTTHTFSESALGFLCPLMKCELHVTLEFEMNCNL